MNSRRKQVTRSFSACWTCRRRRVKCDGLRASCTPCRKHRVKCEGYGIELVWVDPKTGSYPYLSRRSIDFEHTWRGRSVLTEEQLQQCIEDMDKFDSTTQAPAPESNPFVVFSALDGSSETPQDPSLDETIPLCLMSPTISFHMSLGEFSIPRNLTPTPSNSFSTSDDAVIFHHYMTWVAPLMVPVDNAENPWKSVYPSTALQDSSPASKALYHAILAQAAFNLSNLYGEDHDASQEKRSRAVEHYGVSLHQLGQCLGSSAEEYNACMATLYTLVITEGYARESFPWRNHFEGAGGIVAQFFQQQPWSKSTQSWVISQSLALSFEIAQTANKTSPNRSPLTDMLLESVSSDQKFGYTIGATGDVLQTISVIRLLADKIAHGDIPDDLGDQIQAITLELSSVPASEEDFKLDDPELETCWEIMSRRDQMEFLDRLHLRLFRTAALIYLYRTILNIPPCGTAKLVSSVLSDTSTFIRLRGGAVSIWPVFIAAVEATETTDQERVEEWLDISCRLGIENRKTARKVITEVWYERSQQAATRGVEPRDVAVDWRDVQQRLGVDILLL